MRFCGSSRSARRCNTVFVDCQVCNHRATTRPRTHARTDSISAVDKDRPSMPVVCWPPKRVSWMGHLTRAINPPNDIPSTLTGSPGHIFSSSFKVSFAKSSLHELVLS